ncbi:MAG: class I SAM-dependent methyltransferase [Treponema sp.]|nr:class I SAM-dependent methyltransferase [Treponema sp.]
MRAVKTWSTPVVPEEKRLVPCSLCGGRTFKAALSCEGFSYVRCTGCGLVQINPQPLKEEIKRRYGADHGTMQGIKQEISYGGDYLAYELANEGSFLNLQLLALNDSDFDQIEKELMSGGRKPKILDIGCAIGSLLVRLRDRGWETMGVEISDPQAEYCKTKRNLDVRSLPLEENNFPYGAFNVVLASHLIEHLNEPAAFIREVHRILVPGGLFFVTTPNIASLQARLFGSRWRSAIFDHLYLFSVKSLTRMLMENGFTVEKITTWGGLAAGIAPVPIKRFFDKSAKRFGFGDVMIMRARKND